MDIQEFIHGVEGLRSNLLKQARHYLNDADDAEDAVQETLVKLWEYGCRGLPERIAQHAARQAADCLYRWGMGGGLARQSGDTAGGTGGTATAAT